MLCFAHSVYVCFCHKSEADVRHVGRSVQFGNMFCSFCQIKKKEYTTKFDLDLTNDTNNSFSSVLWNTTITFSLESLPHLPAAMFMLRFIQMCIFLTFSGQLASHYSILVFKDAGNECANKRTSHSCCSLHRSMFSCIPGEVTRPWCGVREED